MTLPGRRPACRHAAVAGGPAVAAASFVPQRLAAPHPRVLSVQTASVSCSERRSCSPGCGHRRWPARSFFYWSSISPESVGGAPPPASKPACNSRPPATPDSSRDSTSSWCPWSCSSSGGKRWRWRSWAGALTAAAGCSCSAWTPSSGLASAMPWSWPAAVLWALHVVVVGRAVTQVEVLLFSVGQYLVAGAMSLLLGLALEAHTLPGLAELLVGRSSTSEYSPLPAGYTLQAVRAKAPRPRPTRPSSSAWKAVFAALFGHFSARRIAGRPAVGGMRHDPGCNCNRPAKRSREIPRCSNKEIATT